MIRLSLTFLFTSMLLIFHSCKEDTELVNQFTEVQLTSATWIDVSVRQVTSLDHWTDVYTSKNPTYTFNRDGSLIRKSDSLLQITAGLHFYNVYSNIDQWVDGYSSKKGVKSWQYDETAQLLIVKYLYELPHGLRIDARSPSSYWAIDNTSFTFHYRLKEYSENTATFSVVLTDNSEDPQTKFILKKQ